MIIMRLLLAFSFIAIANSATESFYERSKSIDGKLSKVMADYNKNIAPFSNDSSPVGVRVAMNIVHIDILDSSGEFSLHMHLIQMWKDPRLTIDGVDILTLPKEFVNLIWTPGTTFQGPQLIGNGNEDGGKVMELGEDGQIRFTEKIKVHFTTDYQLERFPFDRQVLVTHLASLYSVDQLKFSWDIYPVIFHTEFGGYKREANGFRISDVYVTTMTRHTGTQSVSTVELKMAIERHSLPFLLRVFSPITTFVLISLLCLFIDPLRHSTPRVIIPSIILTSTIFFVNQVSVRIPETEYVKAVDVWLGTCVAMVFAVFIQSVMVIGLAETPDIGVSDANEPLLAKKQRSKISQGMSVQRVIDYCSRYIFPLVFIIFNVTLIVLYY